jgi:hypothetical protein
MMDSAQAVAVIEAAVVSFLERRRAENPDQPFVDFRPIATAIRLDHQTTRAILGRLKTRRAILWQWDFGGGDIGIILEGGGFASLPVFMAKGAA